MLAIAEAAHVSGVPAAAFRLGRNPLSNLTLSFDCFLKDEAPCGWVNEKT